MFAKEFLFEEVLQVWDFIIERQRNFEGMNFVVLAMLVWARDYGKKKLVKGESFEVLQRLARVEFKGNGKCILFLANKFFRFVILKKHRDKYFLPNIFND